jgi:alkylation response protein AidB-like acyl-CoA dehydrogenase
LAARTSDIDVSPALDAAADLTAFAGAVRGWIAEHVSDLAAFRAPHPWSLERTAEHDRQLHRMLYDAGLGRRGWPVELGGLGGSPLLRAILHEELTAAGIVAPESYVGLEVIAPMVIRFAPHLAARHLPAKLRGDEEWCQGFSEPDAGSDLASLRTRATEDGDQYRLEGQKIWSTNGHISRWCTVLARTGTAEERHRGLTMFWLDLQTGGVEVRPIACASGRNEVAEVFLDGVPVPKDHVVGEVGSGWEAVMYLMQFERGSFAWLRQAWLHTRLAAALAAGSASDVNASLVGDAYLSLCALRERALAVLLRLARGDQVGPESSIAKILLAEAEQAVFDAVGQLLSPGFDLGDDGESIMSRQQWSFSRIVSIYGGAGEVQRDLVAERLLGLPRSR